MIKGSEEAKRKMELVRKHKTNGKGITDVIKYAFNKSKFGISIKIDNLLSQIGNEVVHSIKIVRTKIDNKTIKAIELLSPNFKRKNNFESLYHLSSIINNKYTLEKNEGINMFVSNVIPPHSETLNIPITHKFSIFDMLKKTREYMGNEKFLNYSAKNNNCQQFLLDLLHSNKLYDLTAKEFIKQDTDNLFTTDLRKTANTLTDLKRQVINPISNVLF